MALTAPPHVQLVCFDLDGTLVDNTVYVWSTLHDHFGSDPVRRRRAHDDHRDGRISYEAWFHTDLELLAERGADRTGLLRALDALVPAEGAMETLCALKTRGYKLGLISGSLGIVLERFFPDAPFDHVFINQVHFDPQGRIAGGVATRYDLAGKAQGLAELACSEGLTADGCAFVGDNVNDLDVMRAAGFSVGVNVKHPRVAEAADVVLEGRDLRGLLPLFPGPGTPGGVA